MTAPSIRDITEHHDIHWYHVDHGVVQVTAAGDSVLYGSLNEWPDRPAPSSGWLGPVPPMPAAASGRPDADGFWYHIDHGVVLVEGFDAFLGHPDGAALSRVAADGWRGPVPPAEAAQAAEEAAPERW